MSNEFTLKVGDRDLRISRFRGLKAVLAMDLMARVMREIPEIQDRLDEYIQKYRREHTVRITPAMAKLPKFAVLDLHPEDFTVAGGDVEFPDDPNGQQIFMAMIPEFFTLARREFIRFLALIAIPNSELEQADDQDDVEGALDALGKNLLREGDIDELLELAVVGWDVMQDQIQSKKDRLGKLMQLPFLRALQSMLSPTTEEPETPATLPDDVPISSTPSPADMDGTEGLPSTVSPGMN